MLHHVYTSVLIFSVVIRRYASHVHKREFSELLSHSPVRQRVQPPEVVSTQKVQLDEGGNHISERAQIFTSTQQVGKKKMYICIVLLLSMAIKFFLFTGLFLLLIIRFFVFVFRLISIVRCFLFLYKTSETTNFFCFFPFVLCNNSCCTF